MICGYTTLSTSQVSFFIDDTFHWRIRRLLIDVYYYGYYYYIIIGVYIDLEVTCSATPLLFIIIYYYNYNFKGCKEVISSLLFFLKSVLTQAMFFSSDLDT